jgi:hypothetical protein
MEDSHFLVDDLKDYITANVPIESEMAQDAIDSEFQSLSFVFPLNNYLVHNGLWISYDRKSAWTSSKRNK